VTIRPSSPRTVTFPADWVGDGPRVLEVQVTGQWRDEKTGDALWGGRTELEDGTVLVALVWPKGSNFMRCSPHNNWALEEKLGPPGSLTPAVSALWRGMVTVVVDALQSQRQEGDVR
jgi:hypothetical protein